MNERVYIFNLSGSSNFICTKENYILKHSLMATAANVEISPTMAEALIKNVPAEAVHAALPDPMCQRDFTAARKNLDTLVGVFA